MVRFCTQGQPYFLGLVVAVDLENLQFSPIDSEM